MSGYIWAKIWWGVFILIAACAYGAYRGAKRGWRKGFYGESDSDSKR